MVNKKQLHKQARAILLQIANGETVNGISTDPFIVPKNITLLGSSVKTLKGNKIGVETSILYLSPSDSGGIYKNGRIVNSCPNATKYCRAGCLGLNSGRMRFSSNWNSRKWKTVLLASDPGLFRDILIAEIKGKIVRAASNKMICAIRLNGTSDYPFIQLWDLAKMFPSVQYYDYTKSRFILNSYLRNHESNYHLTYSANSYPRSQELSTLALKNGMSVAVIVDDAPSTVLRSDLAIKVLGEKNYRSLECNPFVIIDGDDSDARFLDSDDESGALIWLKVKGGKSVERLLGEDVFNV